MWVTLETLDYLQASVSHVRRIQGALIDRLPGHIAYLGPALINQCEGVRV
jgi:hypothetical protein